MNNGKKKAPQVHSLSGRRLFKSVSSSPGRYEFRRVRLESMGLKDWCEAWYMRPVCVDGRQKILVSFDEVLPHNAEEFDFILLDESTPDVAARMQALLDKKIQGGTRK
jgi:hypothetical protein